MNLDDLYQSYLSKAGLNEAEMGETQKKETKRAFMAGCGMVLNHVK